MNPSPRLTYIQDKTMQQLEELWTNCFQGQQNDAHIHAHIPNRYRVPNQETLNMFLSLPSPQSWLIRRAAEGDIIGYVNHGNIGGLQNSVGFVIGYPYIGNGYAGEALQSLLGHLRAQNLTETFGYCLASNTASIRTMEGCGFVNVPEAGPVYDGTPQLKFRADL